MAGVITHLVIAKEILKLLPEGTIKDKGLFYLGAFAPDAIHAREGYIRSHKQHTHFRNDIPDRAFEDKDNYVLYQERLIAFIEANRNREGDLLDLYRGYVVHIITDELFILSIRKEFCEVMIRLGIDQQDAPFFENIVTDMNRNDMLLVEGYEGMEEIYKAMEEVGIYPIEGYISEQEMSISRDWLIYQHFIKKQELLQPRYIKHERLLEFIQEAAKEIAHRLSEGEILPKMI